MFGTIYPVNVTIATTLVSNLELAASAALDYVTGTGPLTAPGFGILGFEKSPAASRTESSNATVSTLTMLPSDWPEVEYLGLNGILGYWHNALDQFVDGNYGSVGSAIVAPFSRGNVTIQSADSNVAPLINPNFLSHPAGIDVALAALKRTRAVWAASGVTTGPEYLPGASVSTDDEIIEWIRSSAMTV
jgi:choline dehydrogenase